MTELPNLNEAKLEHIHLFDHDFSGIIKIVKDLDKAYATGRPYVDQCRPLLGKIIKQFNKKYADQDFDLIIKPDRLVIKVILQEEDLKTVFAQAASRIPGIKGIGLKHYDEIDINNTVALKDILEHLSKIMYLSYADEKYGNCLFKIRHQGDDVFMEAGYDVLLDKNSPPYAICRYYALRQKCDLSINFKADLEKFGSFLELGGEDKEKIDRFAPWSREI